VEVLSVHLAQSGLTAAEADRLVFTAPQGGPLSYSNWRRRVWLPALTLTGLPDLTFHDLHRVAGTALARLKVDHKTTQTRMGHSDIRTTLTLYAQATSEGEIEAANNLDERFFRAPPTKKSQQLRSVS
jgi:integrase